MKKILVSILAVITLGVFGFSNTAVAFDRNPKGGHDPHGDFRGRPERHDDHNGRPFRYFPYLPVGYLTLRIADMIYYYSGGTYYQYTPSGYVVVSAPMGAVVPALPPYYRPIPYGGKTYFFYNNTYYLQEPTGYNVVTPPPQVVTSNPPAIEAPEKTIVVTVPNPNGSYIPVTLEKYSDGYKGPNGEFYPDYPTIDQLKAMYAKNSAPAERPLPEELTVDIPNKNGSVTKVTLHRTKDGYVGPEGEYYKEKPTVEQLAIMYGK
ncbi:MAG TPA: hypothetical protein PLL75_05860 [Candidatus Omnitrophota bacterium]|nr:hypothetical protein [Candidatus Omnitrophota bacterium]HPS37233.1 hypothetical protein [Candidatus Omnitrophota bacterium]